jgi:hypothetical protein
MTRRWVTKLVNWTNHAVERALERGIDPAWVQAVLDHGVTREGIKGERLLKLQTVREMNVPPKVLDLVVAVGKDGSVITTFWISENQRFQRAWVLSGLPLWWTAEIMLGRPQWNPWGAEDVDKLWGQNPILKDWRQSLVDHLNGIAPRVFADAAPGIEIELADGRRWIFGHAGQEPHEAIKREIPAGTIVKRYRNLIL